MNKAGLKRQSPGFCVLWVYSRSLGPQKMWGTVESSFGRLKGKLKRRLSLVNQIPMVSSQKRRHFLRLLTFVPS